MLGRECYDALIRDMINSLGREYTQNIKDAVDANDIQRSK